MTDDETWINDGIANTLNAFDAGDTRTTHAVVQHPVVNVASTLQGTGGSPRGQRNDAEGAAVGHLIPQTTSTLQAQHGRGFACNAEMAAGGQLIPTGFSAGQSPKAGSIGYEVGMSPTLRGGASGTNQVPTLHEQMSVRRLTPVECERLMGWPDNWTAPPGVKAPDSKRYAACGDGIVSWVAYWIGMRIQMIESENE